MPSTTKCLVESEYECCTSLEVAADTPSVSICAICRDYGDDVVKMIIIKRLNDLNEYLNLRNGLSPGQILQLTKDIIRDFPYITFADVSVIMNNARCGYYGKFYERLSPADIHEWFRQYFDERCDFFEQRSLQEHEQFASEPRTRKRTSTGSVAHLKDIIAITKNK